MTGFHDHRRAALHLIQSAELTVREGGFVGQMAFSPAMSEKQERWLRILLDRHGLPPLVSNGGGE
jgi:hypothetical protein